MNKVFLLIVAFLCIAGAPPSSVIDQDPFADSQDAPDPPREFSSSHFSITIDKPEDIMSFKSKNDGYKTIELFEVDDECGVLSIGINLVDINGFRHIFWGGTIGESYNRIFNRKILLPSGNYEFFVKSIQSNLAKSCKIAIIIDSMPELIRDTAQINPGQGISRSHYESPSKETNVGLLRELALKNYGRSVDLQSIELLNLLDRYKARHTYDMSLDDMVLSMLSDYCINNCNGNGLSDVRNYGDM